MNDIPETIGYMCPPKATRFQAGQSGNPAGRPRGSKNTYSLLTRMLDGKISLIENGKRIRVTKKFAVLLRLLSSALQGNLKAMNMLLPHLLQADAKAEAIEVNSGELSQDDQKLLTSFVEQFTKKQNNNNNSEGIKNEY